MGILPMWWDALFFYYAIIFLVSYDEKLSIMTWGSYMLFANDELKSEFDYGNSLRPEMLSIDALASEICRVQKLLEDIYQLAEGKQRIIHFENPNQNGKAISIRYDDIKDSFKDRSINDIRNILVRDYGNNDSDHYSIANQLLRLGIQKPTEDDQLSDYLQLLYFLYMTTNVVFPSSEVLGRLISLENHFTTESIPIPGASEGEVLAFIKNSIENTPSFKKDEDILTALLDNTIDHFIESVIGLERLFPVDIGYFPIEDYSLILTKSKQYVDTRTENKDYSFFNSLFPSQKLLFLIERYTRRSDATEVLNNLFTLIDPSHDNNKLFSVDMEDSEYPLPPQWKERFINIKELNDFLRERELLCFCEQKKLSSKELSRAASESTQKNLKDFVIHFIGYNTAIVNTFTKPQENGDESQIYAPFVACIARTYRAIRENKVRIVLTIKGQKKNNEMSLKGALKTKDDIPRMIPYKIAMVICETIYQQCTHPTYSTYYWYMNVKMQTYIYIQKVLLYIFETRDISFWIRYLKLLAAEIENTTWRMLKENTETCLPPS